MNFKQFVDYLAESGVEISITIKASSEEEASKLTAELDESGGDDTPDSAENEEPEDVVITEGEEVPESGTEPEETQPAEDVSPEENPEEDFQDEFGHMFSDEEGEVEEPSETPRDGDEPSEEEREEAEEDFREVFNLD